MKPGLAQVSYNSLGLVGLHCYVTLVSPPPPTVHFSNSGFPQDTFLFSGNRPLFTFPIARKTAFLNLKS